jgi:hypothetical protein
MAPKETTETKKTIQELQLDKYNITPLNKRHYSNFISGHYYLSPYKNRVDKATRKGDVMHPPFPPKLVAFQSDVDGAFFDPFGNHHRIIGGDFSDIFGRVRKKYDTHGSIPGSNVIEDYEDIDDLHGYLFANGHILIIEPIVGNFNDIPGKVRLEQLDRWRWDVYYYASQFDDCDMDKEISKNLWNLPEDKCIELMASYEIKGRESFDLVLDGILASYLQRSRFVTGLLSENLRPEPDILMRAKGWTSPLQCKPLKLRNKFPKASPIDTEAEAEEKKRPATRAALKAEVEEKKVPVTWSQAPTMLYRDDYLASIDAVPEKEAEKEAKKRAARKVKMENKVKSRATAKKRPFDESSDEENEFE